MAFGDSAVGLLFKMIAVDQVSDVTKKMRSNVESDLSAVGTKGKAELDKLIGSSGTLGTSFQSLSGLAGGAASGVAAVGAAGVATAAALFSIAKSASDYGSAINDASEKTGLSAKSISSLKFAADQSGSSLEQISSSVSKFSRLIGESAQGNEKATATLVRFGIDPKKAVDDLDGALAAVIEKIYELPRGAQQGTAAQQAFGKSGADLIPVIKAMKGDFAAFTKEAERLGVVLTDEDARAADEFGDTLDTLKAQAAGVAFQFAKEFMPDITGAMNEVSEAFSENKDTVTSWGNAVSGVISAISRLIKLVNDNPMTFRVIAGIATAGASEGAIAAFKGFEAAGEANKRELARQEANVVRVSGDEYSLLRKRTSTLGNNFLKDLDGKTKKTAKDTGDSFDKTFRAFAKDIDFRVTSTARTKVFNKGSLHTPTNARAGDLSVKGKSISEIVNAMAEGIKKGWQLLDERQKLPGINQTAPHLHFEKDRGVQPSRFLDASKYGGQDALDYLKKLDRDRLDKHTAVDDIQKLAEERRKIEKDAEDKRTKAETEANEKLAAETKKHLEETEKLAVESAERLVRINQSTTERKLSDLEANHKLLNTSEKQYQKEREDIIFQSLKYEEKLYQELAKNPLLSAEKKSAIQDRLREISNEINRGFNETTIRNVESFGKAVKTVDDLLKDFGVGQKTGLEELNVLLADPEVTEAIKRRAEALGYTTAQLKELLRVQQEGKDKGLTTGTRERVVDDGLSGKATEQSRKGVAGATATILGDLFGGGTDPLNKITEQKEFMKAVYADISESANAAIGSMVSGLAQMVAAWISTGKFSAKAALAMVSGVAAGLAIEGGLRALMEFAKGLALAANPLTAGLAPGHFAAAKAFGVAALAAAAVAGGTGLAARAMGGGSSGSAGSASSSSFKQATNESTRTKSNEPVVREEDRINRQERIAATERHNREQVIRHEYVLHVDKDLAVREVSNNIRNRGSLHELLIKTIEG